VKRGPKPAAIRRQRRIVGPSPRDGVGARRVADGASFRFSITALPHLLPTASNPRRHPHVARHPSGRYLVWGGLTGLLGLAIPPPPARDDRLRAG
jgi:hypothetical protein